MTRHTYRPGDAIDPGATYYPMDGARQRDPLEPDDVIAALDAWENAKPLSDAIDAARRALDGRCSCTTEECRCQPKADHWSPWLEWRGGPCPLPGGVFVETKSRRRILNRGTTNGTHYGWCHREQPSDFLSFRYRTPDPAGWLPRGEFIPPAELWDDGCPVRCEWAIEGDLSVIGDAALDEMEFNAPDSFVTHIRLVARQPQAGLPEAQPEPGAVPELPEFVQIDAAGDYAIKVGSGHVLTCSSTSISPDDLDVIGDTFHILAARERARRAGS